MNKLYKAMGFIFITLLVSACSGPLDTKLKTDPAENAYRESLDPLFAELTKEQQDGFNLLVDPFSITDIHGMFPNGTIREIALGLISKYEKEIPGRLEELKEKDKKYDEQREKIKGLALKDAEFSFVPESFGYSREEIPTLKAKLVNDTPYDITKADFSIALYINGSDRFETADQISFRLKDGLKAGETANVTHEFKFISPKPEWSTLTIKNAKSYKIQAIYKTGSALNFSNQKIEVLEGQLGEISKLEKISDLLKKYKVAFEK